MVTSADASFCHIPWHGKSERTQSLYAYNHPFHNLRSQRAAMISHVSLSGAKLFQKIEWILGDSPYDMELQYGLHNKVLSIIS